MHVQPSFFPPWQRGGKLRVVGDEIQDIVFAPQPKPVSVFFCLDVCERSLFKTNPIFIWGRIPDGDEEGTWSWRGWGVVLLGPSDSISLRKFDQEED